MQQHRVTGRYLKQYAIQAKPTNTDSTTASNNNTMFTVLILLPSVRSAREGSSVEVSGAGAARRRHTVARRRTPTLAEHYSAHLLY